MSRSEAPEIPSCIRKQRLDCIKEGLELIAGLFECRLRSGWLPLQFPFDKGRTEGHVTRLIHIDERRLWLLWCGLLGNR